MATILTNTGITFPDATTQTTAASSSGGVSSLNGSTGALNGMTYISSGSFGSTAVSNNYITGLPSGYTFFKVFCTFKFNSVDGNAPNGGLALRLSKDNGSNYFTSGYANATTEGAANSGTNCGVGGVGTGSSQIFLVSTPGGSTNTWVNLEMCVFNAQGSTTVPPSVSGLAGNTSNGGDEVWMSMFNGNCPGNITANQYINALQFFITNGSSKQMNGGYYFVYGMK